MTLFSIRILQRPGDYRLILRRHFSMTFCLQYSFCSLLNVPLRSVQCLLALNSRTYAQSEEAKEKESSHYLLIKLSTSSSYPVLKRRRREFYFNPL